VKPGARGSPAPPKSGPGSAPDPLAEFKRSHTIKYTTIFKFWLYVNCLDNSLFIVVCTICVREPNKIFGPRAPQS